MMVRFITLASVVALLALGGARLSAGTLLRTDFEAETWAGKSASSNSSLVIASVTHGDFGTILARQGQQIIFAWPDSTGGFALYTATNLPPPGTWTPATNAASFSNNQWRVTVDIPNNGTRFFRLQSP